MYYPGQEPSWFKNQGSIQMERPTSRPVAEYPRPFEGPSVERTGGRPSVPPLPPQVTYANPPTRDKPSKSGTKPKSKSKDKSKMTVIEKAIDMCMTIAQKNVAEGHRPFGAVIVPTDVQEALYVSQGMHPLIGAKDQVEQDCDPCAHAEILAIRKACKKFRRTVLSGFTMVCMAYPCPMCLAAMDWARLDGFYYCLPAAHVRIRNLEEMYHKVGTKAYRSVHLEPYQEVARYIFQKWVDNLK